MIATAETQAKLWLDLIKEAATKRVIILPELQEAYLVFMLQRFMKRSEIANVTFALKYMQSVSEQPHLREHVLSDLADTALLFAGMFPERAKRLRVSSDYFRNMSQICFYDRSSVCMRLRRSSEATLYQEIAKNIDALVEVLLSIRRDDPRCYLQEPRMIAVNNNRHIFH